MMIFAVAVLATAAALAAHAIVCRRVSWGRTSSAGTLAFAVSYIIVVMCQVSGMLRDLNWVDVLHIGIVTVSSGLAYGCLFSAVAERSPTIGIVELVAEAEPHGVDEGAFQAVINDNLVVGSRLSAMIRTGHVRVEDNTVLLTLRGRRLARMFQFVNHLFRIRNAG